MLRLRGDSDMKFVNHERRYRGNEIKIVGFSLAGLIVMGDIVATHHPRFDWPIAMSEKLGGARCL